MDRARGSESALSSGIRRGLQRVAKLKNSGWGCAFGGSRVQPLHISPSSVFISLHPPPRPTQLPGRPISKPPFWPPPSPTRDKLAQPEPSDPGPCRWPRADWGVALELKHADRPRHSPKGRPFEQRAAAHTEKGSESLITKPVGILFLACLQASVPPLGWHDLGGRRTGLR